MDINKKILNFILAMGSGEILPGDWTCESCDVNNFARRTHCIDCKQPKESLIDNKEKRYNELVFNM